MRFGYTCIGIASIITSCLNVISIASGNADLFTAVSVAGIGTVNLIMALTLSNLLK